MSAHRNFDYYRQVINDLGAETLERYDLEESADQMEHDQGGGAYTFSALCPSDQAAILHAIVTNLTPVETQYRHSPTSYAIKHAVERYTGFYCSNLQCKVALRILGYKRDGDGATPGYNVAPWDWQTFSDLSEEIESKRIAARKRVAYEREAKKCARYFSKLSQTQTQTQTRKKTPAYR